MRGPLVPFGRVAAERMTAYLQARPALVQDRVGETAVFLNYQGRRITPRSVERIVDKYIRLTARKGWPLRRKRAGAHLLRLFGDSKNHLGIHPKG